MRTLHESNEAETLPGVEGRSRETHPTPARAFLASVFLLGMLITLLGSVLPVWGYHRLDEFISAGHHFLCLALGYTTANVLASRSLEKRAAPSRSLMPGAALALLAILIFAVLPPPFPLEIQLTGAVFAGAAIGILNAGLFRQLGQTVLLRSSSIFQLASLFWLLGAVATPLAVALIVAPTNSFALLVLAPVPLLVGFSLRQGVPEMASSQGERGFREAIEDFRNPSAVLLAMLLFFQLGNEMAIFGWLPVFLIQRLGVSPATGLFGLAAFAFALLLGRVGVQALGRHAWRRRLALAGIGIALLGCLMLSSTNNLFGAMFGIALTGLGFAPIYPTALELISSRFPYFHPGVFNSIFSAGMAGGALAPWSLGWFAHTFGIQVVMFLPAAGLMMVAVILGLLWVEGKLLGVRR